VEHLVRRDPRPCGLTQTRWTLDAIRSQLAWGRDAALTRDRPYSGSVGHHLAARRSHGPRPDPHDQAKLQEIADVVEDARAHPNQVVTVDLDDVTVTRRPTLANGYGRAGADQVRAERSLATDCDLRIVGSLDVVTGQVVTRRAKTMGLATLAPFFPERRAASPEAERIDVILDNWPVHCHPDLSLEALAPASHPVRAVARPGNVGRPIPPLRCRGTRRSCAPEHPTACWATDPSLRVCPSRRVRSMRPERHPCIAGSDRHSFRSPIACRACTRPPQCLVVTDIHFGLPSPAQTHAEMNVGELLRLPIACPDPAALPVDRHSFRSPIACADPCRNECRRTLAPAHRLSDPPPCPLTDIHFGRPSPVLTHAEMNVGELLRLPIACADPGALPVDRHSFRSPIA
jgi:hypothetical protein